MTDAYASHVSDSDAHLTSQDTLESFGSITTETNGAGDKPRRVFGFGDGGKPGRPLFLVNPEAAQTSVNDFIGIAEGVLDDLLNEAIANGGAEANRTWVIELLVHATRVTKEQAYYQR